MALLQELYNIREPNATNNNDEFTWDHIGRRLTLYLFDKDRRAAICMMDGNKVWMIDWVTIEGFDLAIQWLFNFNLDVQMNRLSLYEALVEAETFEPNDP